MIQAASALEAYHRLNNNINKLLHDLGRSDEPNPLTVVTKTQGWAAVEPIIKVGHRVFGENRVQEAYARWESVKPDYRDLNLRLIGPLQSNKAAEAVALFEVIETIDRPKIAEAIADEMQKQAKAPDLYIQVNIGEEPQKSGILPLEADAFIKLCRETYGLKVSGLMCIPPIEGPRGPHFALLAKIAERNGLSHLSMGMSDDYETALRFGSNEIRIGSAIFGARG